MNILDTVVAPLLGGAILGSAAAAAQGVRNRRRARREQQSQSDGTFTWGHVHLGMGASHGAGQGSADSGSRAGAGGSDAGGTSGALTRAGAGTDAGLSVERRTTEIIAWRGWELTEKDGEPILRSFLVNAPWLSPLYVSGKPRLEREFLGQRGLTLYLTADNRPPIDPRRGLYAVRAREFLPSQYNQLLPVIGEVALSGRVIEHEYGYRAERMMIRRLYVHPANAQQVLSERRLDLSPLDLVEKLAERYQCDVDLSAWVALAEIVR